MAKLSKAVMVAELIEIYGTDTVVRDKMIPQIKQEINKQQTMLGLPEYDFAYMRLPDSLLTTQPEIYFTRLMELFFSNKKDHWVKELYKANKK